MSKPTILIQQALDESIKLRGAYRQELKAWLLKSSQALVDAFRQGNKVLIAGNGGSAGDSQHFAAELVVRLTSGFDRPALAAIALTVNSSILTAASNDYGYDMVFSRQLEALGKPGDIFVGITTSGKSENIIQAFRSAKANSLTTLGLFGDTGPADNSLCDFPLQVPSISTTRIQEEHIFALHLLVELTEILVYK